MRDPGCEAPSGKIRWGNVRGKTPDGKFRRGGGLAPPAVHQAISGGRGQAAAPTEERATDEQQKYKIYLEIQGEVIYGNSTSCPRAAFGGRWLETGERP